MNAYRDDLEAAQLRADDLQREIDELRSRNRNLEAKITSGDTAEALANARRLAVALEREQQELRRRHEAESDERMARLSIQTRGPAPSLARTRDRQIATFIAGWMGMMTIIGAVVVREIALGVLAVVVVAGLLIVIGRTYPDTSRGDDR